MASDSLAFSPCSWRNRPQRRTVLIISMADVAALAVLPRHNKELGVRLGVRVAPTFHLYKDQVKVSGGGMGRQWLGCRARVMWPKEGHCFLPAWRFP